MTHVGAAESAEADGNGAGRRRRRRRCKQAAGSPGCAGQVSQSGFSAPLAASSARAWAPGDFQGAPATTAPAAASEAASFRGAPKGVLASERAAKLMAAGTREMRLTWPPLIIIESRRASAGLSGPPEVSRGPASRTNGAPPCVAANHVGQSYLPTGLADARRSQPRFAGWPDSGGQKWPLQVSPSDSHPSRSRSRSERASARTHGARRVCLCARATFFISPIHLVARFFDLARRLRSFSLREPLRAPRGELPSSLWPNICVPH